MRKNTFFILFALLALIIIGSIIFKKTKIASIEAQIGHTAPQFELKDLNGKVWSLNNLKGKIVILNFWASWCDECKEEKKAIQNFLNKNTQIDDVVFVTILFKDDPKKVREMVNRLGYTFPVLVDDGTVSRVYGIKGVPETFLIDKNGILRRKIIGPIQWDEPHIMPHLRKVLS